MTQKAYSPLRMLTLLIFLELLLVVGDVIFNFYDILGHLQIRRLFNVAKEGSIPTWFSVIQLFALGKLSLFIGYFRRYHSDQPLRAFPWFLMGAFFILLSMDDAAQVHERLGTIAEDFGTRSVVGVIDVFPSYNWQIVVGPFFALAGFLMFVFLMGELKERSLRFSFILALAFWSSAVVLDFFEGIEGSLAFLETALEVSTYTVNHFSKVLEEFLEMLGTSVFIVTFLTHLQQLGCRISISRVEQTS